MLGETALTPQLGMIDMKAKPGEIKAGWHKKHNDCGWAWGEGTSKADANLVGWLLFSRDLSLEPTNEHVTLISELEKRGYDPKTLKFSIQKKVQ